MKIIPEKRIGSPMIAPAAAGSTLRSRAR
jgi:hypothetical protein